MLIKHDREKLLNAIIYFVTNTKFCGLTKLFKLLYYLDFIHFKETGRPVTGLDYFAWDFGPVPSDLFFEIKGSPAEDLCKHVRIKEIAKGQMHFAPLRKFDDTHFTKRELRILGEVVYIFKGCKAEEMTDATHLRNHPWDKTRREVGDKKKIDYLLALDETEGSLDVAEVIERVRALEEIERVFSE